MTLKDCHLPGVDTSNEVCQEPVTHSHTKLLMKANMVMNEHFDITPSDVPGLTSLVWLKLVSIDELFLEMKYE